MTALEMLSLLLMPIFGVVAAAIAIFVVKRDTAREDRRIKPGE